MKAYLLSISLTICAISVRAQNTPVNSLPTGKYETTLKNQGKWERGDIILMDENKYKVSSSNEVGDYKFSSAAQRVFFITGPLKSAYAKTSLNNDAPAIVLPVNENEQVGIKLPAEVWCYYRK
jgi:hypothetical protein